MNRVILAIKSAFHQEVRVLKIENKENINEILLSHKGRNVKFECFIKPFPYSDRLDLAEKKPVEIVFDDLM